MKKAIGILAALLLFGPFMGLLAIGALMNPAVNAVCTVDGSYALGEIPDELTSTTVSGESMTLDRTQLTHAATIIEIGSGIDGVGRDGIIIALMAALTESRLLMLANTNAYPESGDYPNDGDGSDHDSLGLFQMRPQSGWGTVEDLMNPTYQARAFYGGPEGPNFPSPRGLLDIHGWQQMDKGKVAQAVEVSAHPERYTNFEPVAETIFSALTGVGSAPSMNGSSIITTSTASNSQVVFPLPEGTWVTTDVFGWRNDPFTNERVFHTAADFSAADGTPILAAASGTVTVAEYSHAWGGIIVIDHNVDGERIATAYVHSWAHGIHVAVGDTVRAGQHIADVGSSGRSTGPHLHFEVREGGTNGDYIDPAAWLNKHNAADLPESEVTSAAPECDSDVGTPGDPVSVDGNGGELVSDPTSEGQITRRMLGVYDQTLVSFLESSWACYSPRPGQKSEHPLGRACDVAFGNQIGQYPSPTQLDLGWEVTNWLIDHTETLGIEYLIWQGRIWSPNTGWRDYRGGAIYDPGDVTGGHYDHLHITVIEN